MKNLKNSTVIVLIALFSITSCDDDFVYVNSQDVNSEDYFNSEGEYINA